VKEIRRAVDVSKAAHLHRVSGGAAHSDEAADRKLINTMVKPEARTGRAAGGSTKAKSHKGKPSVSVNVIAPQGQARPVPVPVPIPGGASAAPGSPLSRPAPLPSPVQGPAPIPVRNVPPMQGPLGPVGAKSGGKIQKRADGGGITAGAGTGLGRLEKVTAQRKRAGRSAE
jgi:hypothetical protein